MNRVVNVQTGETVRIGDKCTFPGNVEVEVAAFDINTITLRGEGWYTATFQLRVLNLEWRTAPVASELMTTDDWIHASNVAKEEGGHFMQYLARAFQHADGSNQPPLKRAYHTHFFRYLSEERKSQLKVEAEK